MQLASLTFDPVRYLLDRKYPVFDGKQPFAHKGAVGNISRPAGRASVDARLAYEEELKTLSADELQQRVAEEQEMEVKEQAQVQADEVASRIYNQPTAQADFPYWAQQSYWTAEELVALSLGRDPRVVHWDYLRHYVKVWDFARDFGGRLQTAMRAVTMGQLHQQVTPSFALAWARRMGVSVPGGLVSAVEGLGDQIADWKAMCDAKDAALAEMRAENARLAVALDEAQRGQVVRAATVKPAPVERPLAARERETLYKIMITMAVAGYGHVPGKRSDVIKEILDDATKLGLQLGDDTVREKLKEAAELLPGEI